MKKKRGRKIKIELSNRWLYTFIILGILAIVGVGVYAATYSSSGAGHPYTEISTCSNGQILKMSGGSWICGSDANTDYCYGGSCSGTLILPSSPSGNYAGQINSAGTVKFSNGGAAQGIYAKQISISDSWKDNDANTQTNGLYVKGNVKIGGYIQVGGSDKYNDGCTEGEFGQIKKCSQTAYGYTVYYVCVCSRSPSSGALLWRSIIT